MGSEYQSWAGYVPSFDRSILCFSFLFGTIHEYFSGPYETLEIPFDMWYGTVVGALDEKSRGVLGT